MIGQASNPMLEQAEQAIASKMPPAMQQDLQRVVHAGLTIMYSPQLAQQRNARIAASSDPVQDASSGAARLISNLFQQSNKSIPAALIIPAAIIFAFEYLDLVAKAGKTQITPDLIAQTTQAVAQAVLPLMGVTPQKMQSLLAVAKQHGNAQSAMTPSAPSGGIIGNAQAGQ